MMSTTTYQLILVGPGWGSANKTEKSASTTTWVPLCNDDIKPEIKNAVEEDNSPAERARLLLEELEKEGSELEDALQDSFISSDALPMFSELGELTSITPVVEPEVPTLTLNCLATSVDTEALLRDLEALLPEVAPPSPPTSSDEHAPLIDIDELLFLRSLSLPDPEPYQPPTPSTSGQSSPYSMASPGYAPSTPMSAPSPKYAPSTPMSASSPLYAPSTPSSASWDSDSTSDPDWVVEPAPGPSRGRPSGPRAKPYSRAEGKPRQPTERRERKKVQNKNAATRYRLKKKAEEEVLLSEEGGLMEINDELKSKVDDLSNEIRIIKGLLRDQCKRLGIIKD